MVWSDWDEVSTIEMKQFKRIASAIFQIVKNIRLLEISTKVSPTWVYPCLPHTVPVTLPVTLYGACLKLITVEIIWIFNKCHGIYWHTSKRSLLKSQKIRFSQNLQNLNFCVRLLSSDVDKLNWEKLEGRTFWECCDEIWFFNYIST